jgi:PTH1 family peptidyl-tRNA hydrolase
LKVVVGLGNPGREYARTRHNVGFRVVEALASRWGGSFRRGLRIAARTCEVSAGAGGEVLLVQPLTYMNASGDAVAPLLRKRGLGAGDVLVIVDDADLEPGRLRLRPGGGSGGHNGLRSLIERLGTEGFARVRVGVGRRGGGDLREHVLSRFAKAEEAVADEAVARAADAAACWVEEGIEAAMNRYNRTVPGGAGRDGAEQQEES